ncbi:MAG: deoxyribodipyrimidine photo-lyase [Bacteroidales bacterium]
MSKLKKDEINIFWFRRDLRLSDNRALYYALKGGLPLMPIFIFDTDILNSLDRDDRRIAFIHEQISNIKKQLIEAGSDLFVFKAKPEVVFSDLIKEYDVNAVYFNEDHEPYGIQRDAAICKLIKSKGINYFRYLDHLIVDKNRILKADGEPYSVYTYFKNKFKQELKADDLKEFNTGPLFNSFFRTSGSSNIPSLKSLGFKQTNIEFPDRSINTELIKNYHETRDYPSMDGTSRLGIHLRFGTLSIRKLMRHALELNDVFYNELIWREFYANVLLHNPRIVSESYKKQYDNIEWLNNEEDFEYWKSGKTGYPFVDAGMRQLNKTGYMHNRVRMVVASFLCKHLLIDWRWGEAYFAKYLLDYELSSNNGGWQWSAGSGCDAAPYFRIFNPKTQLKKFDPDYLYVKKWIQEFGTPGYNHEIVDHTFARERCIKAYRKALNKS